MVDIETEEAEEGEEGEEGEDGGLPIAARRGVRPQRAGETRKLKAVPQSAG